MHQAITISITREEWENILELAKQNKEPATARLAQLQSELRAYGEIITKARAIHVWDEPKHEPIL